MQSVARQEGGGRMTAAIASNGATGAAATNAATNAASAAPRLRRAAAPWWLLLTVASCAVELPARDVGSYLTDVDRPCVGAADGAPCDDSNVQTGPDTCAKGRCVAGPLRYTLLVTTTADPGPSTCDANGCSLRGAILRANEDVASADTIAFATGGTIALGGGLPEVQGALTIDASIIVTGTQPPPVTIDGGGKHRMVVTKADTKLRGITMRNLAGEVDGGAIQARAGTLTLEGCRFEGNRTAGRGGAIFAEAPLVVRDCVFDDNRVTGTGGQSLGGAIAVLRTATIERSRFSANRSGHSGGAIGVLDPGTLLVDRCSFIGNEAVVHGGAIINYRLTTVVNSVFRGNGAATTETGGAIATVDTTKVVHSTFLDNKATTGAALAAGKQLVIENSVLAGSGSGPLCSAPTAAGASAWIEDGSCGAARSGDPLLDEPTLADDGHVIALPLAGSPLLDVGAPASCGAGSLAPGDLRGVARPVGAGCDLGAFERRPEDCAGDVVPLPDGRCVKTDTAGLRIALTAALLTNTTSLQIVPPTSLLQNGGAESFSFDGWALSLGGDGWAFQNGLFGTHSFVGSYGLSWLRQTVTVARSGFAPAVLTGANTPPVAVGCFGNGHGQIGKHGKGQPAEDRVQLRLVAIDDKGKETVLLQPVALLPVGSFEHIGGALAALPSSARKLRVEVSAIDTEYNQGHYGPLVDGIYLIIGALEMRIANEDGAFSDWQPFEPRYEGWQLSKGPGSKTVSVEFRDAATGTPLGKVSDTILVQ